MISLQDKLVWLLALIMGGVYVLPMPFDALLGTLLALLLLTTPDLHPGLKPLFNDRLFQAVALLLLYLGASGLWSEGATLKDFAQLWLRLLLILVFLLAAAFAMHAYPATLVRICQLVIVCATLCAVVAIPLFYIYPPEYDRLLGLFRFDNPGRLGRMYAAALLFLLCFGQLVAGRWRWGQALAGLVFVYALYLSGTRSAWLAALLGVACWVIWGWQPRVRRLVFVAGGALTLLAVVFLQNDPVAVAKLFPRGDSFRLAIWEQNLTDILDGHLWFGWGQLVEHWVAAEGYQFRGPHNMWLALLAAGGLPALLLFCVVLIWIPIRLVRAPTQPAARLALALWVIGLAAFLFNGDRVIDKINFVWFALWFPVAVALAVPLYNSVSPALAESPE